MASNTETVAAFLRRSFFAFRVGSIDEVAAMCESPIELAVFWALCARHQQTREDSVSTVYMPGAVDREVRGVNLRRSRAEWLDLAPQLDVNADGTIYRIDLAVWARFGTAASAVAVELDGHEFHERTKEQAERDKRRDRDLQALGWRVARFTGSQVLRDVLGVADEIVTFARGTAATMRVGEGG